MKKLGEAVCGPLFLRDKFGLRPTELAFRLKPTAEKMVAKWREIKTSPPTSSKIAPEIGVLRIHFSSSLGDPAISEIVARLVSQLPHHRIIGGLLPPGIGGEDLAAGRCECAIAVDTEAHPALQTLKLLTVRRCIAQLDGPARPGHWILTDDDAAAGSNVHKFIERQGDAKYNVVATSSAQLAFWRRFGGSTAMLHYCLPPDVACTSYAALPNGFPYLASIGINTLQGRAGEPWWGVVRAVALSVLTELDDLYTDPAPLVAA